MSSRVRRFARLLVGLLFVLDVVLLAWVLPRGGGVLRLFGAKLSAHDDENPWLLLFALGAAFALLGEGGAGPHWRSALRHLRGIGLAGVAGVALFAWLAYEQACLVARVDGELVQRMPERYETIWANGANLSAGPLVELVSGRASNERVVVRLEDNDLRGHAASYYLYPRLLAMQPDERRWALRQRMRSFGNWDPEFELGPRPPLRGTRKFARQQGLPLVVAAPTEAKVVELGAGRGE